jgi:hypothetical protein
MHSDQNHKTPSRFRLATSATLHCLLGCGIGEVVGVIIGTTLAMSNVSTIVLAVILGFVFGLLQPMFFIFPAESGAQHSLRPGGKSVG